MAYFGSGQDNNGSDCGGDLFSTDPNYISQPFNFFNNENSTTKKNSLNTCLTTKSEEPRIFPSYLDDSPTENTKNLTEYERFQSDNLIGNLENYNNDDNISGRDYDPKKEG